MWREPLDRTVAALYPGLVLVLSLVLLGEGSVVTVLCRPGERVTLPCPYHYEDDGHVSQLSVQWRSPNHELLCHYIKHRRFHNCSAGYALSYRPGSITLSVLRVATHDLGLHVCSVAKRHEFSDLSVQLVRMSEDDGLHQFTVTDPHETELGSARPHRM
ncbi:Hypothetical protein SMAX5B_021159 [Scophthalmus maximus]|uniref:Ig-like domain-containing protein n=1 Tax=Scophthalmus maximus TaxID=52904 RepID=A0A2U9BAT2_SCOMX|nr:Hypothetical protein SMAX5B_021159 [Scophthalmus maximus]